MQVIAENRIDARPARAPRLPPAALPLLLFALAGAISAFTMLQGIDPFDEGLVLQAARRVAHGQLPYRDFQWAYGPAQPYLLAGLSKLFGPSLVHWRILRVLADAGVSVTVWMLARREAGPRAALIAWLAVAGEMAEPRSANPFPFALLFGLLAVAVAAHPGRRTAGAAVLVGLAAAFRLDFALYAAAGVVAALALREGSGRLRAAATGAVLSAVAIAVVYLPFAIADRPSRLYDALIGISLREGGSWTLPFPTGFRGSLAAQGVFEFAKHAVDFYVPLLLVAGALLVAADIAARLALRRTLPSPLAGGLAVFGVGALAYLLSRTDEFHTAPLFAVLAVLLPALACRARRATGTARVVPAIAAAIFGLLLVHGVANRVSALTRPPQLSAVRLPIADGAEAPPAEARAIERMVALVDARVPPGAPIYMTARRSDLVRFNDPLVYVLADRPNPTPQDFGLVTGEAAQQRIVTELARARPGVIVHWTDPISAQREPNLRGRSSGTRLLDRWVAAHYRLLRTYGYYDVLVPR